MEQFLAVGKYQVAVKTRVCKHGMGGQSDFVNVTTPWGVDHTTGHLHIAREEREDRIDWVFPPPPKASHKRKRVEEEDHALWPKRSNAQILSYACLRIGHLRLR